MKNGVKSKILFLLSKLNEWIEKLSIVFYCHKFYYIKNTKLIHSFISFEKDFQDLEEEEKQGGLNHIQSMEREVFHSYVAINQNSPEVKNKIKHFIEDNVISTDCEDGNDGDDFAQDYKPTFMDTNFMRSTNYLKGKITNHHYGNKSKASQTFLENFFDECENMSTSHEEKQNTSFDNKNEDNDISLADLRRKLESQNNKEDDFFGTLFSDSENACKSIQSGDSDCEDNNLSDNGEEMDINKPFDQFFAKFLHKSESVIRKSKGISKQEKKHRHANNKKSTQNKESKQTKRNWTVFYFFYL